MQNFNQFIGLPEPIRAIIKANIDQCKKAFDAHVELSQRLVQGVSRPVPEVTGAMMNFNGKIAEFVRQNTDAAFRHALKLAEAKQPADFIEQSNANLWEAMALVNKQLGELRDVAAATVARTASSTVPFVSAEASGAN
jgi:hypothetical protein